MEHASPRKSSSVAFIGRHLLASAHQALITTRQSVVAKLLAVADSTVLRRTEKYPELMETLAACGVEDFVMRGEKKMPLEHYRHLIWIQLEYSRLQLEMTGKDGEFSA
ncbi:hypothetical protein LLQ46_22975 [Rouxiella badensis]|jgi:hypothetical protein|uniref:hypothetical protein n=1 Tax=Rouxiella badensis TaxID=1646377 RepID=UPI001B72F6C0|nr:hypothetical protein [Rouxiella badensis]MCC3717948.1 hypothetical protein [Rouxiella badensis]MCC3730037.1 hypothetical protein [Rouxiella badensis]MCC3749725.1 hypothetical protein [Rouxiella badensis]